MPFAITPSYRGQLNLDAINHECTTLGGGGHVLVVLCKRPSKVYQRKALARQFGCKNFRKNAWRIVSVGDPLLESINGFARVFAAA